MGSEKLIAGALSAARQERLVQILDEYLVSIEEGAPANPQELLARYPEEAEQLRDYLSGLQVFHAAVAPRATRHLLKRGANAARVLGDFRLFEFLKFDCFVFGRLACTSEPVILDVRP